MRFLQHPKFRTHLSQGMKFIVAGGVGTTIDLLSLQFFVEVLGIDPRVGFVLSSTFGASFVFVINKFVTFQNHEKQIGRQMFKFAMVYGIAIVLNGLLSNALYWTGLHYVVAKIVAIGAIAGWNYALSHGFIFKKKDHVEEVIF